MFASEFSAIFSSSFEGIVPVHGVAPYVFARAARLGTRLKQILYEGW